MKKAMQFCLVSAMLFCVAPKASAVPTVILDGIVATGIRDLPLMGMLFDVEWSLTEFDDRFLDDLPGATAAANAIVDLLNQEGVGTIRRDPSTAIDGHIFYIPTASSSGMIGANPTPGDPAWFARPVGVFDDTRDAQTIFTKVARPHGVPEPVTAALSGLGVTSLLLSLRRRRNA